MTCLLLIVCRHPVAEAAISLDSCALVITKRERARALALRQVRSGQLTRPSSIALVLPLSHRIW